jgi:glycosyltransferase involved in cell wall biosynthesis
MALGAPVVSTAMMGTLDVLKEGEGCLIAEDNHDDFAAKVNRLLSDKALRQQLAESAPAYAASWHEDAKSAELVSLYRQLVTERLVMARK